MIGFGGFGVDKVLASKISAFAALAPVTHLGHMKGMMKLLSHATWLGKVRNKTIDIVMMIMIIIFSLSYLERLI